MEIYKVLSENNLFQIIYSLKTTNIKRIKFKKQDEIISLIPFSIEKVSKISIDDIEFNFNSSSIIQIFQEDFSFYKNDNGSIWKVIFKIFIYIYCNILILFFFRYLIIIHGCIHKNIL